MQSALPPLFRPQQYLFLQDFNKRWQNIRLKRPCFVGTCVPHSEHLSSGWSDKDHKSSSKVVLPSQGRHEANWDSPAQSIKPALGHKGLLLRAFLFHHPLFWAPRKYFLYNKYNPVRGQWFIYSLIRKHECHISKTNTSIFTFLKCLFFWKLVNTVINHK